MRSSIDQTLAKDTYRRAIVYILNKNNSRTADIQVPGMTLQHFKILRQEYRIWRLSQQFLVDTFLKAEAIKAKKVTTRNLHYEAQRYDYQKVINKMNLDSLEKRRAGAQLGRFFRPSFVKMPIVTTESKNWSWIKI